ncbi:MAG TPA: hypothetical protein VK601_08210, partial [Kofleriaceae bacterium]|nr:hypothetical protein [Kofleriaceae bacterium]
MSALTRSALLAVLLEPLLGCPLGGSGGPTGTCPADATAHSTGTAVSALIGDPGCPEWGCGMNSATLADGIVFDELNTNGEPDRHGIRIVKAMIGSVPVKLQI